LGQAGHVFLREDNWDDYSFKTTFSVYYANEDGTLVHLGTTKIAHRGLGSGRVNTPESFDSLGPEYYSLGQEQSYYETIKSLPNGAGFQILRKLRDIVMSPEIYEEFRSEHALVASLTRAVNLTIIQRFRRILAGQYRHARYDFRYFPSANATNKPLELQFLVEPESLPPTNVHAIIGRNGVGKTTMLARMAEAVCLNETTRLKRTDIGNFEFLRSGEGDEADGFANVVSVSFSAFDHFQVPIGDGTDQTDVKYEYVGLRSLEHQRLKSIIELQGDFESSVLTCVRSARYPFWIKAVETLSSDPGFHALSLSRFLDLTDDAIRSACAEIYQNASAGHRLVLLTIARLVETVGDGTLVLLDEPEAHLHPPLLGSFIRAVSELMIARNAVAIVATHSPVVLQELPKKCIWILTRHGERLQGYRPALETFGENLGILTHEAFGLEVKRSGHHALLKSVVEELGPFATYESVVGRFQGQLGSEAASIALALLANPTE
jgi:predicted ATPase